MLDNKYFFYNYDLDATTYKYGRLGGPQGLPVQGQGGVKTTGSSANVVEVTDTVPAKPFGPCSVGDVLVFVVPPEVQYLRKLSTKTTGSAIVVDSAVDLSAGTASWYFYPFRVGATAATNVWHQVSEYRTLYVNFYVSALQSVGGIDYSIEGATGSNLSGIVPIALGATYSTGTITATNTLTVKVEEPMLLLRVGLKANTAATGTDSISVWLTGDLRAGRK
jgi:hypothetical protein